MRCSRATIKRLRDPVYRGLRRAVHASPRGQKAARQKALVMGVAKMLAEESK